MAIAAVGCSTVPGRVIGEGSPHFNYRKPPCEAKDLEVAPGEVELRYLGAGGIALGWKNDVILLGPFFSNFSFVRAGLLNARSNDDRVKAGLESTTALHLRNCAIRFLSRRR